MDHQEATLQCGRGRRAPCQNNGAVSGTVVSPEMARMIAGTGRSEAEALQATLSKLKRLLLSPHITADAECVIDGSGPKGLIWLC